MINHKYKNNVCIRCGCKRKRTKVNGKDVILYDGEIGKTACVI